MRTTALTLVAAFASTVFGAGTSGLPACAQGCIGTSFGSCGSLDVKCICSDTSLIQGLACCVSTSCDQADQEATINFADSLCAGQGVSNLPTAATCASTAAGAASTASGAGSSSATGTLTTTSASLSSALASAALNATSSSSGMIMTGNSMSMSGVRASASSINSAASTSAQAAISSVASSAASAAASASATATSEAKANGVEGMGLVLALAGIVAAL